MTMVIMKGNDVMDGHDRFTSQQYFLSNTNTVKF